MLAAFLMDLKILNEKHRKTKSAKHTILSCVFFEFSMDVSLNVLWVCSLNVLRSYWTCFCSLGTGWRCSSVCYRIALHRVVLPLRQMIAASSERASYLFHRQLYHHSIPLSHLDHVTGNHSFLCCISNLYHNNWEAITFILYCIIVSPIWHCIVMSLCHLYLLFLSVAQLNDACDQGQTVETCCAREGNIEKECCCLSKHGLVNTNISKWLSHIWIYPL